MGHLGNPIAFRLNFEKKWKFNFYVRNIYYPENINNMINIRDYLYYYFTRKKMLYSGFCFSHLYLFKFFKNFYVDVYIYHVDLERTSYELINFLYREYYNSYNNIKYAENKTELQLKNFYILREFSNSDLVVFYITFLLFNQKKHVIQRETYLSHNKIFLKTKLYNKFIVYYYIKYLLDYYRNKSILHQNYKWKLRQKKYWLKKRKKMQMWNKITLKIKKYFNLRWISKKLRKKYSKFIPKKEFTQKWFIRKQYWLNKWWKNTINSKKKKLFFNLFYKKNKFKFFKKMKRFRIRRWSFKSRKSLYDDTFKNQLEDYITNYNNFGKLRKFNFTTLLLYLAKKVKFNKYRNSKTLWKKWSVIYKHYKLLYVAKSLKLKYISNLKSFFFILHLFIYLSKKGSTIKNKGNFFNFRNAIYSNIYFSLFQTLFYDAFDIVTINLKLLLSVLDSNLQKDNIVFNYFFISNDTVSSQLIARYVCLKFKRGFTVRRVIGPLKRELVRVAKKGWGTQKPYIIYHYKAMYKNKKNYVKRVIRYAVKMSRYFFYFYAFKNYKKNNLFIYFNLFKYFKVKNKNKFRFSFYLYFKYTIILYIIFRKRFFLRKFYENYKVSKELMSWRNGLRRINVANLFPVIFNLDKKFNFNYNVKKGEVTDDSYIDASFLNSFRFFHIFLFYKRIKKVNNKAVAISSYLNNNLFNFGIIKSLWSIYINFNKRNTRNKYIPIFNSPIMGLKMVIKGRFSRRDRVSKLMINMGKVPLNTLRAVIDYDFLSVPIKNSAMSFKIYIYRKKLWARYKNNVIF